MRAALSNALYSLAGEEEARELLRKGSVTVKSLGHLQHWLQRAMGWYHLVKVEAPMVEEMDEWLAGLKIGVFLIRLLGTDDTGDDVDQVV